MKKGLDLLQVYGTMEEVNELDVDFNCVLVHTCNFIILFSILSDFMEINIVQNKSLKLKLKEI